MDSYKPIVAERRAKAKRAAPAGYPKLTPQQMLARLEPPPLGVKLDIVIDTDTFNEIDDQFAIVQALLRPDRLDTQAIYAAPFHNQRSMDAEEGMTKSYGEILQLLQRMEVEHEGLVHEGARSFLKPPESVSVNEVSPVDSPAVQDLIARAMARPVDGPPLYVVAIAAITNVASALLLEPRLVDRIVVVWLGGHADDWPDNMEFNLQGDLTAAQVVFDCGVPLVRLPCMGVVSHLHCSVPEIDTYVAPCGAIGKFLASRFREYPAERGQSALGYSKQIWDMAAIAWCINPSWCPTVLAPTPIITDSYTWSFNNHRHLHRVATASISRDPIMSDLFENLATNYGSGNAKL